jgi:hypothetical protein
MQKGVLETGIGFPSRRSLVQDWSYAVCNLVHAVVSDRVRMFVNVGCTRPTVVPVPLKVQVLSPYRP